MKTIELFSGTKSFSKVMASKGLGTLTVDNNDKLNPDICIDIMNLDYIGYTDEAFILWASPPCTAFSVASIGKHWQGGYRAYIPKTEFAKLSLDIVERTIKIIAETKPKYWFIENPRGILRKLINPIFEKYGITPIRHTVTYCQYGDKRMKPTDIWTNCIEWNPKPICHNGAPCHEPAPRGSKTRTQGLENAKERGVIPEAIFIEILDHIESKKGKLYI